MLATAPRVTEIEKSPVSRALQFFVRYLETAGKEGVT